MNLALGTVQFGLPYGIANSTGKVGMKEAATMLETALESNIHLLDTAIGYGDSESCLGEIGIAGFRVVTKLPEVPVKNSNVAGWVQNQVEDSLSRLRIDSLYGLLLHKPMQLLDMNGSKIYETLDSLKNQGLIQKLGVSVYSPDEVKKLNSDYSFDIVQSPFNIIDRRFQTSGCFSALSQSNVEVHVRSAFLQGLLLMPGSELPAYFDIWKRRFSVWHNWLDTTSLSALTACIAFIKSHLDIGYLVVGADSNLQLKEIITAFVDEITENFPDISSDDEAFVNPVNWQ